MEWLSWVLIVGGIAMVVCAVALCILMATATPAQLREETHRMGRAQIPGPGGLYPVPSDKEFRAAKQEHPSNAELPGPDWCEVCQGAHLPGDFHKPKK